MFYFLIVVLTERCNCSSNCITSCCPAAATDMACLELISDCELTSEHFTYVVQLVSTARDSSAQSGSHWPHTVSQNYCSWFDYTLLDCCSSVLYQFIAVQSLQSTLNAGAWLIVRKLTYDHITSTLRDDLHWLLISQWIVHVFKLYTIAYTSIYNGLLNPTWQYCACQSVVTHSATHGDLLINRRRTITYRPRSFAASGRSVWTLERSVSHFSCIIRHIQAVSK